MCLERKFSFKEQELTHSTALLSYIKVQTIVSLSILFLVILFEHYLAGSKIFVLALFIIFSVITTGAMLEQKRWIFHLEFLRFILVGIFIWLSYPYFNLGIFMTGMAIVIGSFYKSIGKKYYTYLYC